MQKFFLNDVVRVKYRSGLWRICGMSIAAPDRAVMFSVCPNDHKFSTGLVTVPESDVTLADEHLYPNGIHKHADIILAYARGAELEYYQPDNCFWASTPIQAFRKDFQYRITDQPKPELVRAKRTLEDLRAAVALAEKKVKELEGTA